PRTSGLPAHRIAPGAAPTRNWRTGKRNRPTVAVNGIRASGKRRPPTTIATLRRGGATARPPPPPPAVAPPPPHTRTPPRTPHRPAATPDEEQGGRAGEIGEGDDRHRRHQPLERMHRRRSGEEEGDLERDPRRHSQLGDEDQEGDQRDTVTDDEIHRNGPLL